MATAASTTTSSGGSHRPPKYTTQHQSHRGVATAASTTTSKFWPNVDDSLIDHLWTNSPALVLSTRNIINSVADHNLIELVLRLKGRHTSPREFIRRCWNNFHPPTYRNLISNIDWSPMYQMQNIDLANNFFEEKIVNILESQAPMTKVQHSKKHKSWLSDSTRRMITERDTAREKARLDKDAASWLAYRKLRNTVTAECRKDKNSHFIKLYEDSELKHDTKTLYRITKQQLGWQGGGPPDSFLVGGKRVTAPKEMADLQNKAYNDKITRLMSNLPAIKGDPLTVLKTALEKWGTNASNCTPFSLQKTTPQNVLETIRKMGNGTSHGRDKIDSSSIKIAADYLSEPIAFLINLSISTKTFACKWKVACVIPLHKGKGLSRENPDNYRPISLLSTTAKITERIIQSQMMTYLETMKQLNYNHHAYRRNLSTTTAMLQLTDTIYEGFKQNKISTLMTLDKSAAFDCVPPLPPTAETLTV